MMIVKITWRLVALQTGMTMVRTMWRLAVFLLHPMLQLFPLVFSPSLPLTSMCRENAIQLHMPLIQVDQPTCSLGYLNARVSVDVTIFLHRHLTDKSISWWGHHRAWFCAQEGSRRSCSCSGCRTQALLGISVHEYVFFWLCWMTLANQAQKSLLQSFSPAECVQNTLWLNRVEVIHGLSCSIRGALCIF